MIEEYVGKIKLNYDYYSGNDIYSDGKVEDELLEIVKKYDEEELNSVIYEKNKWPILYHLSEMRENILEWYPFDKDAEVLEIGAGCGAVTGAIARKCKKVTCIELSKKRSLINAYRHINLKNIEIMVGNFEDIEKSLKVKYDYITLIGVLEYADSYISSEKPYEIFLKTIKQHLKPDGKVMIAIENKFGLKYFAGCQEDHVDRYYEGIEGYTNTTGVCTFSKKEIEKMTKDAGYANVVFYYPYPDYKFPQSIYSDEYLPKKGELTNNIRNFDKDRYITFDEGKVFDNIIGNNDFSYFSNSYLVLLEKGEEV